MIDATLDSAARDPSGVREKHDATREALPRVLDAWDGDIDTVRAAIARLERIEAEVTRVERPCAGRVGVTI